MKKFFGAAMFIFILISSIYGADIKSVVAYPVPFNPHKGILKIGYPAGTAGDLAGNSCKVTVFDINGDIVTVINGTASTQIACIWNGRRSNGSYAKPGLYILKVEISDTTMSYIPPSDPPSGSPEDVIPSGGYWKKVLRVLVKY